MIRHDGKGGILKDGNSRYCVKLADFGLAFLLGGEGNGVDGTINQNHKRFPAAGTCRYMAPEVEFDSRYGCKADVFSLAVVLHVMLTGRFPKTALNEPAEIHSTIPDGLRELMLVMLHGDPYQVLLTDYRVGLDSWKERIDRTPVESWLSRSLLPLAL